MLRDLENRILVVTIVVLFVASIVKAIFGIEARWQIPLVFLSLLAIIRLLYPVEQIHTDVRYLRDLSTSAKISPYPTLDAFYSDLRHALSRAQYTLDLTHIRDNPPADFGEHTSGWFDAVAEWVTKDSARSVRRLIAVRNEAMQEWAEELHAAAARLPQFHIRVVKWDIDAPAVNMAIIDTSVVFLAVTGEMLERTRGIAVEDQAVAQYFSDYYNNLWHAGVPLDEFLASWSSRRQGDPEHRSESRVKPRGI